MKVGVGVIPKEALAVLAAGFGRHNDHWVESIARSFLETWEGAEYRASTVLTVGGGPVEIPACIYLPTKVEPV